MVIWIKNAPYELVYLNAWHSLNWIRKWQIVGGIVSLGVDFGVSNAQVNPGVILIQLFMDPGIELSDASPALHLPVCHQASHCDENGLNL